MSVRILLVEDEPGLVLTLDDLLSAEGYDVETAQDGPTGLTKARTGRFDLILLDIMRPGKTASIFAGSCVRVELTRPF